MATTKSTSTRAAKAPQDGTVVSLAAFPLERKIAVVKAICGATGMKPPQAKKKIESLPATFLALLSNSALAEDLAALGAVVTVEPVVVDQAQFLETPQGQAFTAAEDGLSIGIALLDVAIRSLELDDGNERETLVLNLALERLQEAQNSLDVAQLGAGGAYRKAAEETAQ